MKQEKQVEEIIVKNNKTYLIIKRLFDIVSSFTFLLLFGWFVLLLILIKWIEDIDNKTYVLEVTEAEDGKYVSHTTGKKYNCCCIKTKEKKHSKNGYAPVYLSTRVGTGGKLIKFHKLERVGFLIIAGSFYFLFLLN